MTDDADTATCTRCGDLPASAPFATCVHCTLALLEQHRDELADAILAAVGPPPDLDARHPMGNYHLLR